MWQRFWNTFRSSSTRREVSGNLSWNWQTTNRDGNSVAQQTTFSRWQRPFFIFIRQLMIEQWWLVSKEDLVRVFLALCFLWLIIYFQKKKKEAERVFFWTISQKPSTTKLCLVWQQKTPVLERRKKELWESNARNGEREYLLSTFPSTEGPTSTTCQMSVRDVWYQKDILSVKLVSESFSLCKYFSFPFLPNSKHDFFFHQVSVLMKTNGMRFMNNTKPWSSLLQTSCNSSSLIWEYRTRLRRRRKW